MHVGGNILSVAVKASAEGIDDLILGDVVFQTLRDSRESLVALYQTVKLRPHGGDDDRLSGNIMR